MSYCQSGDKPIVRYQFSGQPQRTYKSAYAPIEVSIKETPVNFSSNYREEGYGIAAFPNYPIYITVRDHKHFFIPGDLWKEFNGSPHQVAVMGCNSTSFAKVANCSAHPAYAYCDCLVTSVAGGVPLIDISITCPSTKNKRCSVEVKYNGIILFQDQGDCPVSFDVSCGNCPEGTEEHKTSAYPGYCCMDCASIAAEIRGLTNTVRGLNG